MSAKILCGGFRRLQDEGVTMIELVITLAIITILAAVVAIGPGFTSTEKIRNASNELLADLQLMRQYAMMKGPDSAAPELRGYGVRFESKSSYTLFRFNDSNQNSMYDGPSEESPLTPGEPAPKQHDMPGPLNIQMKRGGRLSDPDNDVLIFDHLGLPRQANLGVQQMSVVFHHPDMDEISKQCVTVSFNRIREGEWDGRSCRQQ